MGGEVPRPSQMYYDRPKKSGKAKAEPARKPKTRPDPKRKPAKPAKQRPAKPKKQKDKQNNKHTLLKFVALLLVMALLAGGGLYIMPVNTFGSHTAYGAVQKLPSGYAHVLLIGLDLDGKVYAVLMGTLDHLASKGKMVAPEALELKQELEHAE